MVRCCEDILDHQNLSNVLKKLQRKLLDIIINKYAWQAVDNYTMRYEHFFHTLGADSSEQNSTAEFRKTIQNDHEGLFALCDCHELPRDGKGHKLQCNESEGNIHELIVPAKAIAVFSTSATVICCIVTLNGHERPIT